jgi:hypothetical protein
MEQTLQEKKKFDRKEYMKNYMKKRYYEKPEETQKILKNKAKQYRAKNIKIGEYGLDQDDVEQLRSYYQKVLLLCPDAILDILLEFGVPETTVF